MRKTPFLRDRKSLMVLIGIICLEIIAIITTYAVYMGMDLRRLNERISDNIRFMVSKCDEYGEVIDNTRASTQITMGEEILHVTHLLDDVDEIEIPQLERIRYEHRLTGITVVDENLEMICEATSISMKYADWKDLFQKYYKNEIPLQKTQVIMRLVNNHEGGTFVFAVKAREHQPGFVIGYRYLDADFVSANQMSLQNLLVGYMSSMNGVMILADGNMTISANEDQYIGKNIENSEYVKKLKESGPGKLIRLEGSDGIHYGRMEKHGKYDLYAIYPSANIFEGRRNAVFVAIITSAILLIILFIVNNRAGRIRLLKELEYQEKLKVSAEESNRAKSSFLSRMSHDIRTPLNQIIGLLEISAKHPEDMELIAENRKNAMVASKHLLSLINDVLDMSKLEDGQTHFAREQVNLAELMDEIHTIAKVKAVESGITLKEKDFSSLIGEQYVYGSPLHIRQIFVNIIGNAIKYNDAGGFVDCDVELLGKQDQILTYRWTITDDGRGMSEEFQKHLFEPFSQETSDARSVYQGTGLGMAITKALVDKMGGTISVESQKGVGSTFYITIPFELVPENELVRKQEEEEVADISGMHILLVEDNDLNLMIAQFMLEDANAKITTTRDGKEALELFEKEPPQTFDVILMDIMMPEMDGLTATREIRKLATRHRNARPDASHIPIIAMTANAFTEDVMAAKDAGMDAHIAKPIEVNKMLSILSKYKR